MYKVVFYVLKLLSFLPFWLLYLFADVIYLFVYHVIKYRVKVVRTNINNSFPTKTKQEKRLIEKGFYRHFSDMLIEILKMMSLSPQSILKRMNYVGYEPMLTHYTEGKSVIMMTSHNGNWEWTSSFSLLLPKDKPVYQVYKKLKNEVSDKVSFVVRKRFGAQNIEMKELLREMVTMKNENRLGMFGMISDQSPRYTPHLRFMDFLHQPTPIIEGSEQLAKKFDFPLYYASIRKVKRGYYTCTFELITLYPAQTEKYEITEKYMKLLERDIFNQPQIWLWSHKRWKHLPPKKIDGTE